MSADASADAGADASAGDGRGVSAGASARELAAIWLDDEPLPLDLSHGRFTAQLRGDSLSDIAFDGVSVVRAIRFIVRDRDWRTIPAEVLAADVTASDDGSAPGLRVVLRARNVDERDATDGPVLEWHAVIEFGADTIRVSVSASVLRPFWRNRIGVVVLHPPGLAGAELSVRHPSGDATLTRFPVEVSPHQPAFDIRGLDWTGGGVRTEINLFGDVFEMEDQRNWTDASFKTYGTPLSEPFPVEVRTGDEIVHEVTVRCTTAASIREPEPTPGAADPKHAVPRQVRPGRPGPVRTTLRLSPSGVASPEIVVGASTAPGRGPNRPAHPTNVLVELDCTTPNWPAALERAAHETGTGEAGTGEAGTGEAGTGTLDVRIVATEPGQLDAVLDALARVASRTPTRITRLAVFSSASQVTEPALWRALVDGAASRSLAAELVGGARSHFTELNRTFPRLPADLPSLTFSVTPQMHDRERAQVIESVAMHRVVALQAVRIADGRRVHVGPITLRPRYNAVATTLPPAPAWPDVRHGYGAHLVDGATDPRQCGHGYAAWLVAVAVALSVPGVASLAFAESWGLRGLVDELGERYPASYAVEWLADIAGWDRLLPPQDVPAEAHAVFGAHRADATVLLFANATSTEREFIVEPEFSGELGSRGAVGELDRLAPGSSAPVRVESLRLAHSGRLTVAVAPGEIVRWRSAG